MTNKEQETIDKLYNLLGDIRKENSQFREDINKKVDTYTDKVDKKVEPVYLEQDIVQVAKNSIQKAIADSFTAYDNPMTKLVKSVVQSHYDEIRAIVDKSLMSAINTDTFEKDMTDEFSHKVVKTLINKNEGMLEKFCNDLRQDVTFRSKLTLAIDKVVTEYVKEKNNS